MGQKMAKGSEAFAWLLFSGAPKRCRQCGKEPLRVQDVGEHRRLWPSQETQFLCKSCQRENVLRSTESRRLSKP
jgi:predicted RNA-binding Zn-ribbon protein involved in translation (DUF1610 family)